MKASKALWGFSQQQKPVWAFFVLVSLTHCYADKTQQTVRDEPVGPARSGEMNPKREIKARGGPPLSVGESLPGIVREPSKPCRLETIESANRGSRSKSDPNHSETVEVGVKAVPEGGETEIKPYVQYRCQ